MPEDRTQLAPAMGYFTPEQLAELHEGRRSVTGKQRALMLRFVSHQFQNACAREHGNNGFARRLMVLTRCVDRVFDLVPPETNRRVDDERLIDATAFIQSSFVNVFGAIDNLAWIWVSENSVRKPNGDSLPASWVGLRRSNAVVRKSLPGGLRAYLESLEDWFEITEEYRDALAHRIPPYIPPYYVLDSDADRYRQLENARNQAICEIQDLSMAKDINAQQKALEGFRPWMTHSYGEAARPLVFHPQIIANFNTVAELGERFIEALEASAD